MEPDADRAIFKFWIIHSPSGICIFEQSFQDLPGHIDPDLTAGYLFAITTLSQEIARQDIQFLQLEKLRFVYGITQNFMMVILTRNDMAPEAASTLLTHLQAKFTERYKMSLTHSQIFEVTKFHDFARVVEEAFQMEAQYFHILEKREGNIEDFFQNAADEWKSIQKTIMTRAKKMGAWVQHQGAAVAPETQQEIMSSRNELKEKTAEKAADKKDSATKKPKTQKWV